MLPSTAKGDHYRKLQLVKIQRIMDCGSQDPMDTSTILPILQAQEQEDRKIKL